MEMVAPIFAVFMVIWALFVHRRRNIPAFFYMGTGGLLALCEAEVPILKVYKEIAIGLGLFAFGWGFARAVTIDSQRSRDFRILELFPGRRRDQSEPPVTPTRPSRVKRSEGLISAVALILAGLVLWYIRSAYSNLSYIFLLFGLQLLVASLIFLGRKKERS